MFGIVKEKSRTKVAIMNPGKIEPYQVQVMEPIEIPQTVCKELERLHKLINSDDEVKSSWAMMMIDRIHCAYTGRVASRIEKKICAELDPNCGA